MNFFIAGYTAKETLKKCEFHYIRKYHADVNSHYCEVFTKDINQARRFDSSVRATYTANELCPKTAIVFVHDQDGLNAAHDQTPLKSRHNA